MNGGDNFVAAKGYLVAYESNNPTKTFTGTLNTGDKTFNLQNSGSKNWTYVSGWNLMGNPYSSSIDWNLATRTQFQDEFAYMYDPNKDGGAGYVYVNGASSNAYIPLHQGFFVLATQAANGQNFTFSNSMQTHGDGTNVYKENDDQNNLELILSSEQYYDNLRICQNSQSDWSRDRYDALKMFSFDNHVPQVFSISNDNIRLAVNSLPQLNEMHPVPLGMRLPEDGVYELQCNKVPAQLMNIPLYIEDLKSGNWHRIDNTKMSFQESAGEISDRFVLHMGIVDIEEPEIITNPVQVFVMDENIKIINNHNLTGNIILINIIGQKCGSFELEGNSSQSYAVSVPSGIYVVYVKTGKGNIYSEKLFIK